MKRVFLLLIGCSIMVVQSFALEWTCYRQLNGEPTGGYVKVYADSKYEATKKAIKKYKELGYSLDGVECE